MPKHPSVRGITRPHGVLTAGKYFYKDELLLEPMACEVFVEGGQLWARFAEPDLDDEGSEFPVDEMPGDFQRVQ